MRLDIVRHFLLAFNIFFWVAGGLLVALGLFAEFDSSFVKRLVTFVDGFDEPVDEDADAEKMMADEDSSTHGVKIVATYVRLMSHGVIALGSGMALVGFCGCCGAWRRSKSCLGVFFTLLLLCLLLTLALGGGLFFVAAAEGSPEPVAVKINKGLEKLVEAVWEALTPGQRMSFERAHKCCSLKDADDLLGILERQNCGSDMASRGCFDKVVDGIRGNFGLFGGVLLILAAFEIISMALSCCLFQSIRKTYNAV